MNRLPPAVLRGTSLCATCPDRGGGRDRTGLLAGGRIPDSSADKGNSARTPYSPAVPPGDALPNTRFHSKGLTPGEVAPGGDGMPLVKPNGSDACGFTAVPSWGSFPICRGTCHHNWRGTKDTGFPFPPSGSTSWTSCSRRLLLRRSEPALTELSILLRKTF